MSELSEEVFTKAAAMMKKGHDQIVEAIDAKEEVNQLSHKIEQLETSISWMQKIAWGMVSTLSTVVPFVLWFIYNQGQETSIRLSSSDAVLDDVADDLDKLRNDIRQIYTTQGETKGLIARIDKLQDIIVREIDD